MAFHRPQAYLAVFCALALVGAPSVSRACAPTKIAGLDLVSGRTVDVDLTKRDTVVVFLSAKCPCSIGHQKTLRELHAEYSAKGFRFVGVNSNADESSEWSRGFFAGAKLEFPVVRDDDAAIADAFHAMKTPHVFVLRQGKIVYQGGIDDAKDPATAKRHYLREALASLTAGRAIASVKTRSLGCLISR